MARFKDFGTGTSPINTEPLSFKLYDEEFHCVPEVQGRVILELVADSSSTDPSKSSSVVEKFFGYVLEDESFERFQNLLNSKDRVVSVDTLGEITGWLVEEYTNRPE